MNTKCSAPADLVAKVLELLPGVDCAGYGGCGKATCAECAEAIVSEGKVALCPACNQEVVDAIAEAIGAETAEAKDEIAFIACSGDAAGKARLAAAGCKSCKDAVEAGFQRGECKSGCVGIGSCIDVCKFDAMSVADGDVSVISSKCTGCGACANANVCPQTVIRMIPREATNFIPCSSKEEDDDLTRKTCGFGCIACGDCVRACPQGAIEIIDNHAVINYDLCVGCEACTVKCKKKIIVDTLHDLTKLKDKVAFVRCSGGKKPSEVYKSLGYTDCQAVVDNVDPKEYGLCTTGCTGQGNCTRVCRYGAIQVVDGTAVVDPDKCVACKDCTYACPKGLITIVPYKGAKMVPCSSTADYEDKAAVCDSACIACGDCKANCPNGAIYAEGAHAVVDPEICENCNVCQYVCSREIIKERVVPEYNYLQREALKIREGE